MPGLWRWPSSYRPSIQRTGRPRRLSGCCPAPRLLPRESRCWPGLRWRRAGPVRRRPGAAVREPGSGRPSGPQQPAVRGSCNWEKRRVQGGGVAGGHHCHVVVAGRQARRVEPDHFRQFCGQGACDGAVGRILLRRDRVACMPASASMPKDMSSMEMSTSSSEEPRCPLREGVGFLLKPTSMRRPPSGP